MIGQCVRQETITLSLSHSSVRSLISYQRRRANQPTNERTNQRANEWSKRSSVRNTTCPLSRLASFVGFSCLKTARCDDTCAIITSGSVKVQRDASLGGGVRSRAYDRLARALNDDGAGTLPAMRRDQGESYRDLRHRGSKARNRGQDRQVPANTGKGKTTISVTLRRAQFYYYVNKLK